MPPFAGQGVNTGLMDALLLSDKLLNENCGSVQEAIAGYEQEMFTYAAAAQYASTSNEKEMLLPDFSFGQWIR